MRYYPINNGRDKLVTNKSLNSTRYFNLLNNRENNNNVKI